VIAVVASYNGIMRGLLLAVSLALAWTNPSWAQSPSARDFPLGEVIEKVEVAEDPSQSYALYLPPNYARNQRWPILYLFDARGRAMVPAKVFREAAERYGYILASSYNTASDDAVEPDIKAIRTLWRDTHERFPIDARRVYMAGFSGEARVAFLMADAVRGAVTGVIAVGAGFSPVSPPREGMSIIVFGTVGNTDFNHDEMIRLDATLDDLDVVHRVEIFEGGHSWPPVDMCTEAVTWMELHAMKSGLRSKNPSLIETLYGARLEKAREAELSKAVYDAYHRYLTLSQDFAGLRDIGEVEAKVATLEASKDLEVALKERQERLERDADYLKHASDSFARLSPEDPMALGKALGQLRIDSLKKRAADEADVEESLSAQRCLESVFVQTSFYVPRRLFERKDYERAILSLSIASRIKPESVYVWFSLARAQALAGRTGNAVKSLERAVEAGLTDADLIKESADLESLRDKKEFRRLIQELETMAAEK
jgi:poly(3-hydroxybutyrate) depolymerase